MHRPKLILPLAVANILFLTAAFSSHSRAQTVTHNSARNDFQESKPAGGANLAPGVVIEKVVARADPSQSYALYLPSSYDPSRKFPILYGLDPAARGTVPVIRFKEAAEKYNYIVVGSNNSRNVPTQPLSEIISTLWEDTHERLSIDDKRVYLAGLSGGARVSFSVAFAYKEKFAGVIACSAGYPATIKTNAPRSFVVFETSGVEDFNNPEMQVLARALEGSPPASRLVVFAGGHEWLPIALAGKAIEWLELKAMEAGSRNKDEVLIDDLFKKAMAEAHAAEDRKEIYEAWLLYGGAAQDFRGLRDVTEPEQKAAALKATKEVREAIKQERRMEDEQERFTTSIQALIDSMAHSENKTDQLSELKSTVARQRKLAGAEQASNERTVARRVIASFSTASFEQGNQAISQKNYDLAIAYLSLGMEVQPDNPRVFFQLSRVYAFQKNTKLALSTLQTAAAKGFFDLHALSAGEFDAIRNQKGYQEIYDKVKQNQETRDKSRR